MSNEIRRHKGFSRKQQSNLLLLKSSDSNASKVTKKKESKIVEKERTEPKEGRREDLQGAHISGFRGKSVVNARKLLEPGGRITKKGWETSGGRPESSRRESSFKMGSSDSKVSVVGRKRLPDGKNTGRTNI